MKLFRVTEVLSPFCDFSKIPPGVLAAAADRGTRAHRVCLDVYAAGLPVLSVPDDCRGFFKSFREWFDAYVAEVFFIEKELIDDALGFYGHVDLICRLIDGRVVVVDLKTPIAEAKTWKSQTAAYLHLAEKNTGKKIDGYMSLMIDRDGKPAKAKTYPMDGAAFAGFLSALNAFRFFKS